jgi:DNA modification methylase
MPTDSRVRLSIELISIDQLKLDPRNPRTHSDRQINQLARSIKTFGFIAPVLADRHGNVLAGAGRVLAGRSLGRTDIPTIRIEHLTEAQAKAFRIADNRLAEISAWDDQLLGETLGELSAVELDFDIEATGFTMGEIDLRIEGLQGNVDGPDNADVLPPTPTIQIPVSRPGDIWHLRKHRLGCSSALDPNAYKTLMDGAKASVVITDPPYNVIIDGHASGLGNIHHREFAMASGEMTGPEFTAFLTQLVILLVVNTTRGSIHYLFMDWRHMGELLAAGRAGYSDLLNLCVWSKHNAGMGSFYRSQHELVFVFKAGRGRHRNNISLGRFGRNRSNVWSYPGVSAFGRGGEEGNLAALHPTVKPVRLVADAILDASARDEIVLDPFLGSGTTVIASERVGRVCYGMEIDPLYVDTIIRRWQAYSGDRAVHAETGISFDEIAASAENRHE